MPGLTSLYLTQLLKYEAVFCTCQPCPNVRPYGVLDVRILPTVTAVWWKLDGRNEGLEWKYVCQALVRFYHKPSLKSTCIQGTLDLVLLAKPCCT